MSGILFFTVKSDITVHQNGKLQSPKLETKAEPDNVTAEPEPEPAPAESVSETTDSPPTDTEPVKKRKEKSHGFGKLFKKKDRKAEEKTEVQEKEKISSEEQVDASQLHIEPQQVSARVLYFVFTTMYFNHHQHIDACCTII